MNNGIVDNKINLIKNEKERENANKAIVKHPATLKEAGLDGAWGMTGVRIGTSGPIDYNKLGNVFL